MADTTLRIINLAEFRDPSPLGGRVDIRSSPIKRRVLTFPKYTTNPTSPTIDTEAICDNLLGTAYGTGTNGLKLRGYLRGASGNISGVCVLEFAYDTNTGAVDDSGIDSWGTPVTGSVTVPTTAGLTVAWSLSLVKANTGSGGTPVVGETGRIRLRRLGTNASDTSTGAVEIIGCLELVDY